MITVGGPVAMVALVVLAGVVTGVAALIAGRWLGWQRAVALWLLVWSVACLFVITLVPFSTVGAAIRYSEVCSFDYDGPAPTGFWIVPGGQRLLNTLVFAPSGFLLVWTLSQFRRGLRWAPLGLIALIGCSVTIELLQQTVSRLGRACDVTDLVDNGIGATLGVVLGLAAVGIGRLAATRRPRVR